MTKPNFTAIALIVDESGSMESVSRDTIGGINTFLKEQKQVPGDSVLTFATFNYTTKYRYEYANLQTIPEFTSKDYRADGGTAMCDAIGKTIVDLGKKLASLPEEERPSMVLVAILTDGEENASTDYDREDIKQLIEQQQNVYSWKFVFLGANQNAVLAAGSIGIKASSSMQYTSSGIGTRAAFTSLSKSVSRSRSVLRSSGGASASSADSDVVFTAEDIAEYNQTIATPPTPPAQNP